MTSHKGRGREGKGRGGKGKEISISKNEMDRKMMVSDGKSRVWLSECGRKRGKGRGERREGRGGKKGWGQVRDGRWGGEGKGREGSDR